MTDPSTIPAPSATNAGGERLVRIGVLGSGFVADFYLDGLRDVARARAVANYSRSAERARSEEHTSELQSHVNLVCRLLLEKKKRETISLAAQMAQVVTDQRHI